MILSSHFYKLMCLTGVVSFLAACSTAVPPAEQIHMAQKEHKTPTQLVNKQVENTQRVLLYRCDNDKKVEVEQPKIVKKSNKKETITVTYNGTTYSLSSVVTKQGKKYTNIRWTWHELRNGKAFLYNNTKKTLAENCVKQP